jgi:hypothetical protein
MHALYGIFEAGSTAQTPLVDACFIGPKGRISWPNLPNLLG